MSTDVASIPQAASARVILEMATAFQRSRVLLTAHEPRLSPWVHRRGMVT